MICRSCGHENPDGSAFCSRCGAPLSIAEVPAAPALPTSFADGRYAVERKLGEGGQGIVFLCQDTTLGRRVAIKLIKDEVMDPDTLARFQQEAQAMGQLFHPNVVIIHDMGQEGERYFLVLELLASS